MVPQTSFLSGFLSLTLNSVLAGLNQHLEGPYWCFPVFKLTAQSTFNLQLTFQPYGGAQSEYRNLSRSKGSLKEVKVWYASHACVSASCSHSFCSSSSAYKLSFCLRSTLTKIPLKVTVSLQKSVEENNKQSSSSWWVYSLFHTFNPFSLINVHSFTWGTRIHARLFLFYELILTFSTSPVCLFSPHVLFLSESLSLFFLWHLPVFLKPTSQCWNGRVKISSVCQTFELFPSWLDWTTIMPP